MIATTAHSKPVSDRGTSIGAARYRWNVSRGIPEASINGMSANHRASKMNVTPAYLFIDSL